jgi:O-antigen/teichoic acid export membrane protein
MRLSLPKLRAMVLFGLPMIPVSLCGAVMHNADRFLIRYFCSLSDVGLYSLGYLFPMSLNALVLGSFNSIWGGATLYEISKAEDAPFQYGRIATYFMSFFVTCMFALALFSKSIVRIFAAPAFFEAHQIIPIVCFGFCLHAFYSFTTMGAFIKGKTSILIPAYIIPAILNIVANMVLLPRFGYGAAAWTTVLTYGVFAFLSWFVCRKMIQIHFETTRLVKLFSAALSVFVLYRLCDRFESVFATIVIQITLAVLFPAILYLSGFLTPQEHRVIKQKGLTLLKHLRMAHS